MLGVCLLLLYLGIVRKFEPLLLVTIGFGGLLSNIPGVEIATGDGLLHLAYVVGIETGAFPLIIFMGVGALTDFGPLLANPRTLFLGAAAQFGIFATLLGALGLTELGADGLLAARGGGDRHHRRRRRPDRDLRGGQARAPPARRDRGRRLFLHGAGAADSAADHEAADDRRRSARSKWCSCAKCRKAERIVFPLLLLLLVASVAADRGAAARHARVSAT